MYLRSPHGCSVEGLASSVKWRAAHRWTWALPHDHRVVDLLRQEGDRRPLVLCTASDSTLAEAVAAHVGGFVITQ